MVLEIPLVRQAYDQMLTHEVKQVVRKLRTLPLTRLDDRRAGCGRSARELAEGFVARLRRIDLIAFGHVAETTQSGRRPIGSILVDLETAFLAVHSSLAALTPAEWREVIRVPSGTSAWSQARRGELLWLALRELIRHSRHLALHIHAECQAKPLRDDFGGPPAVPSSIEPVGAGA